MLGGSGITVSYTQMIYFTITAAWLRLIKDSHPRSMNTGNTLHETAKEQNFVIPKKGQDLGSGAFRVTLTDALSRAHESSRLMEIASAEEQKEYLQKMRNLITKFVEKMQRQSKTAETITALFTFINDNNCPIFFSEY